MSDVEDKEYDLAAMRKELARLEKVHHERGKELKGYCAMMQEADNTLISARNAQEHAEKLDEKAHDMFDEIEAFIAKSSNVTKLRAVK